MSELENIISISYEQNTCEEEDAITYDIRPACSTRGQDKLFDSLGYNYIVKRILKDGSKILWRCAVRNSSVRYCPASVTQTVDKFIRGPKQHLHEAVPGRKKAAKLKRIKMDTDVKKQKMNRDGAPAIASSSVLMASVKMPKDSVTIKGYDFNNGIDYHALLTSYEHSGFQATHFGRAVHEINKMIAKKQERISEEKRNEENLNPCAREITNCTIFLAYTSNLISSGVRETIRFLAQHNLIDCLVTSAGGIEEDFIKCLGSMYVGEFHLRGKELRKKGLNRTGNLIVPNDNYCKFEDWVTPILDTMLEEQKNEGVLWTPSKIIHRLGKEIDNPESIYYWAYMNNIPVFCPGITDGSFGDMVYFHSYKNPGLIIDVAEDIRRMNNQAVYAIHTGMIILGGGIAKHHTCNANLMRNGADFSVYVSTAMEYDGSDSGARPDEAVSWGKIKADATAVKVYADATLVFPLLVAETFARSVHMSENGRDSNI